MHKKNAQDSNVDNLKEECIKLQNKIKASINAILEDIEIKNSKQQKQGRVYDNLGKEKEKKVV